MSNPSVSLRAARRLLAIWGVFAVALFLGATYLTWLIFRQDTSTYQFSQYGFSGYRHLCLSGCQFWIVRHGALSV
jgi:hypothetical protein